MDLAYIEKHHVIDRYVQDKLDDSEREAFEIFMLEHPSVADDVELARGYLKAIDAQDSDLQTARSQSGDARRVHKLWRPLAIAASVLLAVSFGLQSFGPGSVDRSTGQLTAQSERVIRLEVLRSDSIPRFAIANDGVVKLEIEVDDSEPGSFTILIRKDGGEFELRREALAADNGFVVAHIAHPSPGRFSASVERAGGSESRRDYRFELYSNP